ncbi:MAG: hypothetical protein M5R36_17845 [Deltaproteobacteria bacterium]|nr:hypothetical protein [Deltaproteobacteria bacterium]
MNELFDSGFLGPGTHDGEVFITDYCGAASNGIAVSITLTE